MFSLSYVVVKVSEHRILGLIEGEDSWRPGTVGEVDAKLRTELNH